MFWIEYDIRKHASLVVHMKNNVKSWHRLDIVGMIKVMYIHHPSSFNFKPCV